MSILDIWWKMLREEDSLHLNVQAAEKVLEELYLGKKMSPHTTFNVENVMLVQRPATEVGRVQLESLKKGGPFLPQN